MATEIRKELGKIKSIRIGHGGYQDAMFGITFDLGGKGWGVGDFWGCWSPSMIKVDQYTKWTEADRSANMVESMTKLDAMLKQANVNDAMKLVGKPIEVSFDSNMLKSWRLLTEVL